MPKRVQVVDRLAAGGPHAPDRRRSATGPVTVPGRRHCHTRHADENRTPEDHHLPTSNHAKIATHSYCGCQSRPSDSVISYAASRTSDDDLALRRVRQPRSRDRRKWIVHRARRAGCDRTKQVSASHQTVASALVLSNDAGHIPMVQTLNRIGDGLILPWRHGRARRIANGGCLARGCGRRVGRLLP